MAPSLGKAFQRRWWIAITAILENLMFAAVLLGWSSLLLMLKNEGFYAFMCYNEHEIVPNKSDLYFGALSSISNTSELQANVSTASRITELDNDLKNETEKIRFTPSGYRTCKEQDEMLNRYFSIGSSLLSAVTILLGFIMDRYGSRAIRMTGSLIFLCSCLLFAIGSIKPNELSFLMAPAVCMNGMGGITYIFTSFPIPNFFANLRSTMISLMIGSYSASALMYMLFKALYDYGASFTFLMGLHGGLAFLTFLNAFINQPGVPIPAPGDLSYAISLKEKKKRHKYNKDGTDDVFEPRTDTIGRKLSGKDNDAILEKEDSSVDIINKETYSGESKLSLKKEAPAETFLQVLMTPCYWWSVVTMCLTQLRLIAYMGWLELYVTSSAEKLGYNDSEVNQQVNNYARLFGILQINCFLMAPVIGSIMDYKLKTKKKSKMDNIQLTNVIHETDRDINGNTNSTENIQGARKRNIKKQQITNLFRAFLITNLMLTGFGIIVQIDSNLPLQVVAFFLHTAVRTFLHSSTGGLYAAMYHFSHFGKLTGLTSFLGAVFILIQDPLFVLINDSFDGNPFWINFGMLIATILGFGLPLILWMESRKHPNYEPITSGSRYRITDDDSDENLVSEDEDDEEDITLSKGALTF